MGGTTCTAHSFNPYAYFCHSWSYFDIQNLRLVILYLSDGSNNIHHYIKSVWFSTGIDHKRGGLGQ